VSIVRFLINISGASGVFVAVSLGVALGVFLGGFLLAIITINRFSSFQICTVPQKLCKIIFVRGLSKFTAD